MERIPRLTSREMTSADPRRQVEHPLTGQGIRGLLLFVQQDGSAFLEHGMAGLSSGMSEMRWNANWHERDSARESLVLRRVTVATEPCTVCPPKGRYDVWVPLFCLDRRWRMKT